MFVPPCAKVSESHFKDDEEAQRWFDSHIEGSTDPEFAARPHENWKLAEHYYIEDKGTSLSNVSRVTDQLSREASEVGGAFAALGDQHSEPRCKRVLSPSERHKLAMDKSTKAANKLQKLILGTEGRFPVLKRKLAGPIFCAIKLGLQQCRELKENALDALEDLRSLPSEEEPALQVIERVLSISKELSDGCATLQEALTRAEAPPSAADLKDEDVASSVGDANISNSLEG